MFFASLGALVFFVALRVMSEKKAGPVSRNTGPAWEQDAPMNECFDPMDESDL